MDMIKYENYNATTRRMISQQIRKFRKFENFREKYRFSRILFTKNDWKVYNAGVGWRGTLRVLRAETWLTVYRALAILNRIKLAGPGTREHL